MAKKILAQISFWILFFFFWYEIVYFYVQDNIGNRLLFTFLDIAPIIIAFYLVYFYAVPKLLFKKKPFIFFLTLSVFIPVFGLILIAILRLIIHSDNFQIHFSMSWNYTDLYSNRFFIVLFGVMSGLLSKLSVEWFQEKKKAERIEYEKTTAELKYLRNQVNPHFLFNSLNTIYLQLDDSSALSKNLLVKFSDILRYQLYDCNDDYVPILKEVEFINNYIKLQQYRKEANFDISFTFDLDWQNKKIAPLLLIPFVENAFKYVSTDSLDKNRICVSIEKNNGFFIFNCINTFTSPIQENGIGISNAQRRLELIYPDNHSLKIYPKDGIFNVHLQISL